VSAAFDVVIPSAGRESLALLLRALGEGSGPAPGQVIVVDDRAHPSGPLHAPGARVIRGRSAGPAAARNAGWRAARAPWVAFLDDDVVPEAAWRERLASDLRSAEPDVGAVQGRVRVPLPGDRPPTDWERNVAGLETARWATADMAFRRDALAAVGGFDERFPRAYREDSDIGLRLTEAGMRITRGDRCVQHPAGQAPLGVSLAKQAGNADDQLMRALHGPRWRERAGAPPGRLRSHVATTAAGAAAITALASGRPRAAVLAALGWIAGTAELAWRRIAPGPRTGGEVVTMLATSALMPPLATAHSLRGFARYRIPAPQPWRAEPPDAVLLDRDGTLVVDVPYNGDPGRVTAVPGAREAVNRLRRAGLPLAVITNQSGVARGLIDRSQVSAVNERVEELLGPFAHWAICTHGPDDGCGCRKPAPGLVREAAGRLGVHPERCAVVGDIDADMQAARAAGARGVLVPDLRTRPEEIDAAAEVAPDLPAAVDLLIGSER
jgi:histidinol-phosphate phosphatase family protein